MAFDKKSYMKKYNKDNRKRKNRWTKKNPEYAKLWRTGHPQKVKEQNKNFRSSYQVAWRIWFLENGYIPPSPQFHYHHIDPRIKEFEIGKFVPTYPCSIKWQHVVMEELEKCILLSSKEHKQLHMGLSRDKI